jgi:hypothetical protein
MIDPAKVKPGQPITGSFFRRLLGTILSLEIITEEGSGLRSMKTSTGTILELDVPAEFPIRITAVSAGKYAWNAVQATTGGTWTNLTVPAGTLTLDWAIEENGQAASVPQVVWARREPWTDRLVFSRDTCT